MVVPSSRACIAAFAPLLGIVLGVLPLLWLILQRKRRLPKFAKQLPDALELIARACGPAIAWRRASTWWPTKCTTPIAHRVRPRVTRSRTSAFRWTRRSKNMTDRVPNLDLRFFATAVILQRQTGGDLAEILDKIGYLVRERFKIWGQVQALTGEGRLSGIVLLGPAAGAVRGHVYLNPDYVMMLFTDPMGQQDARRRRHHADPRRAGDPQDRQYQGVMPCSSLADAASTFDHDCCRSPCSA